MTASLAPVIKFRWFDDNGKPLSGGKVFTYAAGTSTPLDTYTDYSATVANTNPVILDSQGYANIWLSDQLYKFIITDSNDVTLITEDNVGVGGGGGGSASTDGGFGQPESVASGSVVNLGGISSHFANITGTTTISSFGTTAVTTSPVYLIKFQSSLTLTHSSNLLLPNGQDIVTQSSDYAWVEYLGSSIWRVYNYARANGNPLRLDNIQVTGTITGDGALTMNGTASAAASVTLGENTTNGTNKVTVIAPAAITTDRTQTLQDATGVVALVGDIGCTGSARASTSAVVPCNTSIPLDDTIPQNTEGTEVLTVSYTPKSASSTLKITANFYATAAGTGAEHVAALFRDATANAIGAAATSGATNVPIGQTIVAYVSSAATTATTFRLRHGLISAGTSYVNGNSAGNRLFGGVSSCTLVVEEYQ